MKANELRLGNLVLYSDKNETPIPTTINIDISDLILLNNSVKDVLYEPIPLTEECLIKFGFYNSERLKNSFIKNGVHIYIQDTAFWYDLANDSIEVKTIHQLQNLYFALTNEELTMK